MRVLIVSDTHRHNENFFKVMDQIESVDLIIHCGDVEGSEYAIWEGAGCEVLMVVGNNDFFSALPKEIETTIGNYKVLITHGHNYYVSMSNELLKKEARARGCNIVFYGHTHRPLIDLEDDVMAINPGSLSYPRQEGKKPTYVIMEIDNDGIAHFLLKTVN